MTGIRKFFWLMLSVLTCPLLAQGAKPAWIQLEGEGYRIYSQMPEPATREWSVELDRFIGAATSWRSMSRR